MRRPAAFLLLTAVFALAVVACGDDSDDPAAVVESWSRAINAGDDEKAAVLFADGALVIQGSQRVALAGHDDALSFNASLPCGGTIVDQEIDGDEVTATFTLTRRPGHVCDGTGASAVALFRIADGEITLWHQLPTPAASTQSA